MGIALGLGYLFILKPAPEVKPPVAHRSMSAQKKPLKPLTAKSEPNKADSLTKVAEGNKGAYPKATDRPIIAPVPPKDTKMIESRQNKKFEAPKKETVTKTIQNQAPETKAKDETETLESLLEEPTEITTSSESEKQKETLTNTTPPEDKKKSFLENVSDKTFSLEQKKPPSEPKNLSPPPVFKMGLSQKPLTSTEKSIARAEKFFNKGNSYQQQGELNRAMDSYKRALSLNPDYEQAHLNLATVCLQLGKFKEAEQELVYLWALKPKDSKILFNFGLLLYQTGDHASAETKLKRLLEFDPYHLEGNLLLSSIYEEKGEWDQAIEHCMNAYRVNSNDPRVLYQLGRAFDLCGDEENAVKYYRLFLLTPLGNEEQLKSGVQERLSYLLSQKEGK